MYGLLCFRKCFDKLQTLLLCKHLPGVLFDNFFCVACIIFALTVFKGNDVLHNLSICKFKSLS